MSASCKSVFAVGVSIGRPSESDMCIEEAIILSSDSSS